MDNDKDKFGLNGIKMFQAIAEQNIGNKNRLAAILRASVIKLTQNPKEIIKVKDKLYILLDLLRDWMNGNYHDISRSSIITLVGGLIYFIVPTDILPDIIPLTGFIDDLSVISFVYAKIAKDIERYEQWKETCIGNQEHIPKQ